MKTKKNLETLEATTTTKRKKPLPEVLSLPRLYEEIENAPLRDYEKAITYFLYLTGARASEANKVLIDDFDKKPNPTYSSTETIVHLPTLKNPSLIKREVTIPTYRPIEKAMWRQVQLIGQRAINKGLDRLIPYNRFKIYRMTTKIKFPLLVKRYEPHQTVEIAEFKVNPHYLRHCRLTHLVDEYGLDAYELMQFAGWSNTNPASIYVNKSPLAVANKMRAKQALDLKAGANA